MEVSKYLRDVARSIPGKEQLIIGAFARAFEIIPQQLCYNAGFDATDLMNKLRQRHAHGRIFACPIGLMLILLYCWCCDHLAEIIYCSCSIT